VFFPNIKHAARTVALSTYSLLLRCALIAAHIPSVMSNGYQQRGPSLQTPKHKRDRRHTPSGFHILSDNVDNLNSLIKDRFWELGQATKILVDQIRDLQAQLTTEKHSFNVLLSLITSLGKATTNSVDEHAPRPPQRKNSNASVNPLHTNLRVGLKRSRCVYFLVRRYIVNV
ncbi:hypothetical protein CPC08DRAFT_382188, partial [Agrocybe pediades]